MVKITFDNNFISYFDFNCLVESIAEFKPANKQKYKEALI